nr:unnamed protein product [Callosobruchus chinensis]
MEIGLKELNIKRGAIKARLTNFKKYLDGIINKESLSDAEILELQQKTNRIRQSDGEFADIQCQIESIDANLEDQYAEREIIENNFDSYLALASSVISKYQDESGGSEKSRSAKSDRSHSGQSHNSNSSAVIHSRQQNFVKLRPIDIPTFDGTPETWLEFRDSFKSMVHENSGLDNIQKYHHLRACLQGKAAQVIKSVDFTADDYPVAYQALLERYDNPRKLIDNHVKSLFQMEKINKASSNGLRTLIDSFCKHLLALKKVGKNVDDWNTLIIHLLVTKLDDTTLGEWEKYCDIKDIRDEPQFDDLKKFLLNRADFLERFESKKVNESRESWRFEKSRNKSHSLVGTEVKCPVCNKQHSIQNCSNFLKMTAHNRLEQVKKLHLCINCLKSGHYTKQCRSTCCKTCGKKHHSSLHFENNSSRNDESPSTGESNSSSNPVASTSTTCLSSHENRQILLSTALIEVQDSDDNWNVARALLDSGSQSCYITEALCSKLNLNKSKIDFAVSGLNNNVFAIKSKSSVRFRSTRENYTRTISCYILPTITGVIPNVPINTVELNIPSNISLADPSFCEPCGIDILIGAELFWELLLNNEIRLGKGLPILHKTKLGYIISGPIALARNRVSTSLCCLATDTDIQTQLNKFWEVEEVDYKQVLSKEQELCETHFLNTTTRDGDGRFVVKIPLKGDVCSLGNSKSVAESRLVNLERKLQKNDVLKTLYVHFINEYQSLGHMSLVENDIETPPIYYLPHHGVLRENSLTTRLRVVFDGSMPSSTGYSLNHLQMIGPNVQDDLRNILLRFRFHKVVLSADISKMYRQVLIAPEQRDLQRILWREDFSKPLETFKLNTVTYGTASAAYLATRCIKQLGLQCEESFPEISRVLLHDFYVDDLLTAVDSVDEAIFIYEQVSKVLRSGCFELRKWLSNSEEIVTFISSCNTSEHSVKIGDKDVAKTLGLVWNSKEDNLSYSLIEFPQNIVITKRVMLSEISQIYDPLGLLSACTILAKITLQQLWLIKLSWDEIVPDDVLLNWCKFRDNLSSLNSLCITRHVICENPTLIEMHGFCDASEAAYGGCIYILSKNQQGDTFVNLLCAKTKVAPIKSLTIPKLELCGALILAKLARKVIDSVRIKFDCCTFWADSTIVLGWLRTSPHLLKVFAGNRVAEILSLTGNHQWRHVDSKQNPADLLSRGVFPEQLVNCKIWWEGPAFLKQDTSQWPNFSVSSANLPEFRPKKATCLLITEKLDFPFEKFSSLSTLKRVISWIYRFVENCRKPKEERNFESLSVKEIDTSFCTLIKIVQHSHYASELKALVSGDSISKSNILNLSPFVDKDGILRVGGRLRNSPYVFDKKHPILLPPKCHLSLLIFRSKYLQLYHVGPSALLAAVRDKFWITSGRNLAKDVVKNCKICFRQNSKILTPSMGQLPKSRFACEFPFNVTGTDYAGPFLIKDKRGRGAKLSKAYLCIFICFSVKAIHVELVTSLSTETFIMALRRFVSRRGLPSIIYSDNGRNYTGANSELKELACLFQKEKSKIVDLAAQEGITWKFIPAHSPHFGGLWEAGVKSFKYHLKRTLGNCNYTYEEFSTILVQIEAILNSRPLCPLSSDPNDYSALTPAHFIIGRAPIDLPDPDVTDIPENRLSQYQRIQAAKQRFWQRWHKEYINQLQVKSKWLQNPNRILKVGDLALIKEDHVPPSLWRLGRVIAIHSGVDGQARVATLKTSHGEVRRAFSKICPLPLDK